MKSNNKSNNQQNKTTQPDKNKYNGHKTQPSYNSTNFTTMFENKSKQPQNLITLDDGSIVDANTGLVIQGPSFVDDRVLNSNYSNTEYYENLDENQTMQNICIDGYEGNDLDSQYEEIRKNSGKVKPNL